MYINREQLRLLFTALHAGDSLGSTSEFEPCSQMPALYERLKHTGWPLAHIGGGSFHWPAGAATDDTDMALAICRAVIQADTFSGEAIAQEFARWYGSAPRDIGNLTRSSLSAVKQGVPWHEAGLSVLKHKPNSAGNGALMRNAVVVPFAQSLYEAFDYTFIHAVITHAHPMCIATCSLQTWLLWELLQGNDPIARGLQPHDIEYAWGNWLDHTKLDAVKQWRAIVKSDSMADAFQVFHKTDWHSPQFNPWQADISWQSGYTLLTAQVAVWVLMASNMPHDEVDLPDWFDDRLRNLKGAERIAWIPLIGEDADTYGASAAPLIAARFGTVPDELTAGLEKVSALDELLSSNPE